MRYVFELNSAATNAQRAKFSRINMIDLSCFAYRLFVDKLKYTTGNSGIGGEVGKYLKFGREIDPVHLRYVRRGLWRRYKLPIEVAEEPETAKI